KTFFKGIRVFIWARLKKLDLVKKYGEYVIITGATDGIGLEFAKRFAERGHSLFIIGRNPVKLESTKREIEKLLQPGKKVNTFVADLSTTDLNVYKKIESELQPLKERIGILFNNAGYFASDPDRFANLKEEDTLNTVNVNVTSVLMLTKIVLPLLVENKKGLILNTGSLASIYPTPFFNVYGASKTFVEYFGESIAYEYKDVNIEVQTLTPSMIETKMTEWSSARRSFLVPNAKQYVDAAFATIGRTSLTTGFWTHGIQYFVFVRILPAFIYKFLSYQSVKLTKR
ncbi:hydroxysteroid dehydrogenase-like protein 3, partial [Dinothrombium tinctorium]